MEKKFNSETEINKDVEKLLVKMMKDDPARVMMYFVVIAGKEAVLANAANLKLSTEADIKGKRYKIITVTKVYKIPSLKKAARKERLVN